jgi:enterochelin esterase-like enzyme
MIRVPSLVFAIVIIAVESGAQDFESPRLQALRDALVVGAGSAVESFWKEMADKNAPLIERLNEHEGYGLVTFVWRGESGTEHVFVQGQLDTNVWYRSYWLRNDIRTLYRFVVAAENERPRFYPDPFAPRWETPAFPPPEDTFVRLEWSILELPGARPQPWVARRPSVPGGRTEQKVWKSTVLGNERQMWVYTPANYDATRERPHLLISTDGVTYVVVIQATATLDNLIAAKRIPSVVAVFVGNAPTTPTIGTRLTRSIELSANETFVKAVANELVPWVRSNHRATNRASETIIAGFSLGGLNAAFSALRKPALFGNVLSQSGAFWWRPPGDVESDWLAKQFAAEPRSNVKFYIDVGLLEAGSTDGAPLNWLTKVDQPIPYGPSMLLANRHI